MVLCGGMTSTFQGLATRAMDDRRFAAGAIPSSARAADVDAQASASRLAKRKKKA